MFIGEVSPILQELMAQPLAFLGGFTSGVLRLKLDEDPLKSWLESQQVSPPSSSKPPERPSGPQSITID